MRGQGKVESTEVKENRKWQCLARLNECWCAADGNECLEWGETEVSVGQRGREIAGYRSVPLIQQLWR